MQSKAACTCLRVCVEDKQLHSFEFGGKHAVDSISTTPTDSDDLQYTWISSDKTYMAT